MLRHASIAFALLSAGCAANVAHEVATDTSTGLRYYENAPYLIVYSDGKGGLQWQIRYLPDQTRLMTATPRIRGGRVEMALNFQNGVLASASTVSDTTEVPNAIIAAVQSALPLIAKAAAAGPREQGFPAPALYKIDVQGEMISFIGDQGDIRIQVPINQGMPK